ncbi:DUF58 domain-containing protein [Leucobacter sp. M11]|uniref:DUF58 domain-containing protein n=1 Tax=Leucobacter sp. M11 TaxID=2993565 RepID=UPI002D7F29EE|nr:DUF58 domain-containing protein [Leucobacter sp. M11]MEB4615196.1 DUF58 domain-containing protein [Leucobacter sp. M11]
MSQHTTRSTSTRTGASAGRWATEASRRGDGRGAGSRRSRLRHLGRAAAARAARFGEVFSPAGWLVLGGALLGLLTGAALGWAEGWFLAILCGALLLLAAPFLLGGRAISIRVRLGRERTVAGGHATATLDVRNPSSRAALPATAELPVGEALHELRIPLLASGAEAALPVHLATPDRGVIPVGPVTLARRDPIGLLRREVTWTDRHRLFVHPVTARLPQQSAGLVRDLEGRASRRLTDADLSFHAVREYASGDSLRHVHWRSTAKAGTLMVRQYEESQLARLAVLFDALLPSYADAAEFELGVSVAASLSSQAIRDGRERYIGSGWTPARARASVDGLEELPSHSLTRLLDSWAALDGLPEGPSFERLARRLGEIRRDLSIVFVVTGSRPELSRLRRAAIAYPPSVAVVAVRCERLAEPAAQRLGEFTVLTVGALADLGPMLARGGAR